MAKGRSKVPKAPHLCLLFSYSLWISEHSPTHTPLQAATKLPAGERRLKKTAVVNAAIERTTKGELRVADPNDHPLFVQVIQASKARYSDAKIHGHIKAVAVTMCGGLQGLLACLWLGGFEWVTLSHLLLRPNLSCVKLWESESLGTFSWARVWITFLLLGWASESEFCLGEHLNHIAPQCEHVLLGAYKSIWSVSRLDSEWVGSIWINLICF